MNVDDMNEDDKLKDLNTELFSEKKSSKELFYYFRVISKTFFLIIFKRTFSRENKEKIQAILKEVYLELKFFINFIIKGISSFLISLKEYIVKYSKKLYAITFSEKNKLFINNLMAVSKEKTVKGSQFALAQTNSLYKKTFSESNQEKFKNGFLAFKEKSGKVYKRILPPKMRTFPGILILSFVMLFLLLALPLSVLYARLPSVSEIKYYHPDQSTEIVDINNVTLTKIYNEENRVVVAAKDLPPYVSNAVIAMEDERFFKHNGVDLRAITRALISSIPGVNLVRSGGSTITQQLARNIYLTQDRTFSRKINESLLALKIENALSKERILEVYLNEVYWGHGAYGIEAAAKTYFGKSAKDLNLSEASVLGGLLSSPEYYSPYKSMKKAKWRQSLTLDNMTKNNFISETDAQIAKKVPLKLVNKLSPKKYKMFAPYFSSHVIAALGEKYGDDVLKKGGLKVQTTIDLKMQQIAENLMANEINKLSKYNITQGALISIEPQTGFIKAMVGGRDYEMSQFNRVTQALRQPGSSFKPFVYLEGFRQGLITPNTYIKDGPTSYKRDGVEWSPQNYDKRYKGNMTIRQAIKSSTNTIAVKVAQKAGISKVIKTAHQLGIDSDMAPNLTLALGTSEVSPINMAEAYTVFANNGKKAESVTSILKIQDRNGKTIEDFSKPVLKQVYPAKAIAMLNSCLRDVISRGGTGYAANIPGLKVYGKTGTTSDNKDSWFIGYTSNLVTLVWLGNDNSSKMINATGGKFCAPIWKKYMTNVLNKEKIMLAKIDDTEEIKQNVSANQPVKQVSATKQNIPLNNSGIASIALTNNVPASIKKRSNKPYYVIYVDQETFEKMAKNNKKNGKRKKNRKNDD